MEIKETMAITISNWYTEYRLSYPPESHQAKRRDLDYPIAVLLPVLIQLVFPPQNVEDIIQIPSPPEQNSSQLVPYPAWGREYNDILQTNTCFIDRISRRSIWMDNILRLLRISGYFIEYLRTKDLCNERYFTNFRCHQCNNTFDTISSLAL